MNWDAPYRPRCFARYRNSSLHALLAPCKARSLSQSLAYASGYQTKQNSKRNITTAFALEDVKFVLPTKSQVKVVRCYAPPPQRKQS